MNLSERRRRSESPTTSDSDSDAMSEIVVPTHFQCPISLDLMKDPVTVTTGITYDRDNIEKWIESGRRTCPVTNQDLAISDQIPNHAIRRLIQDWCVQNKSHGVERIPTPRIPATPVEIAAVCARIAAASARGDKRRCLELARKIGAWAKDSERNRRCIRGSLAGSVLAASFAAFSVDEGNDDAALLGEILALLPWAVSKEGIALLGNKAPLRRLAAFLSGNDLLARQNASLVIKELLVSTSRVAGEFTGIEGSVEGLIGMIREPVCLRATKASLTAVFCVVNSGNFPACLQSELVSALLESIVDGDRGVCERALRVLDAVCNVADGHRNAHANALTVPLVVKRLLRVSDVATELSVSILWRLLATRGEHDDAVWEALRVGAFEKVLVVLQIGCGERTKAKVKELLKLFNVHRRRSDCVDPSDEFKYPKRSF